MVSHDRAGKAKNGYECMYGGSTSMQDCVMAVLRIGHAHLKP